jgi:hypothetical protein
METIMGFLIFSPALAMAVYFIVKDTLFFYRAYLVLPVLLCFWAARNYIVKNYLYILSFVPVFAAVYYITGPAGEKIPVLIYLAFAAVFSIMKRANAEMEYRYLRYLIFGNIVLLAEYIISTQQDFGAAGNVVILHSIVFSLLCMIYIHITRTRKLMEWEKQTSRESIKRINRASSIFLFYLSLAFISINLIIIGSGLTGLGKGIIPAILSFLRKLFTIKIKPQENQGTQGSDGLKEILESMGSGEPSLFVKIILFIVQAILWCLVTCVILFAVYALLRALYQTIKNYMTGRKYKDKEKESLLDLKDIAADIKERLKIFKKGFWLQDGLPNNRRIRRIYYKIVMKSKKI